MFHSDWLDGISGGATGASRALEHYHGYLPVRPRLVEVEFAPGVHRCEPQGFALFALGGARAGLELFGLDLNLHLGIGAEVVIPAGMRRPAALRRDDDE